MIGLGDHPKCVKGKRGAVSVEKKNVKEIVVSLMQWRGGWRVFSWGTKMHKERPWTTGGSPAKKKQWAQTERNDGRELWQLKPAKKERKAKRPVGNERRGSTVKSSCVRDDWQENRKTQKGSSGVWRR